MSMTVKCPQPVLLAHSMAATPRLGQAGELQRGQIAHTRRLGATSYTVRPARPGPAPARWFIRCIGNVCGLMTSVVRLYDSSGLHHTAFSVQRAGGFVQQHAGRF
jgi:hypothetical protein